MWPSPLLEFDDYFLLRKAIKIRKNHDSELKCCCGLLEVINFDKEAKAIKKYLRASVTVFFRIPQEVISEEDGEELKNIFYGEFPFDALVQSGDLLMSYHEKNHCTEYLTCALKFYLTAFNLEVVKDIYAYYSYFSVEKAIIDILKVSCKYRVCESVFADIFRVFYTTRYYISFLRMLDYSSNLEEILEITEKCEVDVLDVWKRTEEELRKSGVRFYCSLFENVGNIVPLIRHGKIDCITIEKRSFLWSTQIPHRLDLKITKEYGSVTFRSLQILNLLQSTRNKSSSWTTSSHALKVLWNNITDPFLRQEDFNKSFNPSTSRQHDLLQGAWNWYAQVLRIDDTSSGPRSLCHLSRCSIRRQLSTCRQLPCGVELLDVPKIVKKYILLEDYNDLENVENK